MHVTQGTFSFLPNLTDRQISHQIEYCLRQGWAVGVEFTDDIHPRNTYWEMWGLPMFDLRDAAGVMAEVRACREANPNVYVRVTAFDSTRGWETVRLSFLVQRPAEEPGFRLDRLEAEGRTIRYSMRAYAADQPAGGRYKSNQANAARGDER
jgi:ribulose-bisphosphate carboxylase small chain